MLSYGQKKRVAIAGAVAMRPRILILDEPMAGLDPSGPWHLMSLLTRLNEAGTTLVVATHDMSLAYEWADEVAVLRDGGIVAHGEPQTPGMTPPSCPQRSARAVGGRHRPRRGSACCRPDMPSPRTRDDLKELLARRCGLGRPAEGR